jgi:hypothetical protein
MSREWEEIQVMMDRKAHIQIAWSEADEMKRLKISLGIILATLGLAIGFAGHSQVNDLDIQR